MVSKVSAAPAEAFPSCKEFLPRCELTSGRYSLCFARSAGDLLRIQKLRFEVFNLELGEGLKASFETGLDQDEFDEHCHHLAVAELDQGEIVGTYRVQTSSMAEHGRGFYSSGEFDLASLPPEFLAHAVEAGRACVAKDHRNGRVLTLLWRGLAAYLIHNQKRYLFGCASLPTQDLHRAKQMLDFLEKGKFVHSRWSVEPRPEHRCFAPEFEADVNTPLKMPPLFASYVKMGAKIAGPPALDRTFGTIDFLMVLDIGELEESVYKTFFP